MGELGLIVSLTDIIRLQDGLIDDLFKNLSKYITVYDLERLGYVDRMEEIVKLLALIEGRDEADSQTKGQV